MACPGVTSREFVQYFGVYSLLTSGFNPLLLGISLEMHHFFDSFDTEVDAQNTHPHGIPFGAEKAAGGIPGVTPEGRYSRRSRRMNSAS